MNCATFLCFNFSVLTVWDRQRPISAIFGTKKKKAQEIHTLIFLKYKSNTRHRLLDIIFLKHSINCRNPLTHKISYFTAFFAIKEIYQKWYIFQALFIYNLFNEGNAYWTSHFIVILQNLQIYKVWHRKEIITNGRENPRDVCVAWRMLITK